MVSAKSILHSLTGVTTGHASLARMKISSGKSPTKTDLEYEVLYNPTQLSISRGVAWDPATIGAGTGTNQIVQRFVQQQPATLSVSLFFDTYERRRVDPLEQRAKAMNPVALADHLLAASSDVREQTNEISRLAEIDRELHRPPSCRLEWGTTRFDGVLASVTEAFTMFLPDGTPVRATLDCSFSEILSESAARRFEMNSNDVRRTYTTRAGDTLWSIAHEFYGDTGAWRDIARANDIRNPRRLIPGTVVEVPDR